MKNKKGIDLSIVGNNSITNKVELLISKMEKFTHGEIKKEFVDILNSPETSISNITKNKWMNAIEEKTSKVSLMKMITSLYLAGCDMKVPK